MISQGLGAAMARPVDVIRRRAATALRRRVAGADADAQAQQIWGAEGERWFTSADPIADRYVAQAGLVAARLGVVDPPISEAQLRDELDGFRAELEGTPAARSVARYLLVSPPLPWPARPGYAMIATGAVATLPNWARRMLGVPRPPVAGALVDAVIGRPIGSAGTAAARWMMSDPPAAAGTTTSELR